MQLSFEYREFLDHVIDGLIGNNSPKNDSQLFQPQLQANFSPLPDQENISKKKKQPIVGATVIPT